MKKRKDAILSILRVAKRNRFLYPSNLSSFPWLTNYDPYFFSNIIIIPIDPPSFR